MTSSTRSTSDSSTPSINAYLAEPLRLGEPDVAGPLAVFPLFGAQPREHYVPFAVARSQGMKIGELQGGASVNDLRVENPTRDSVLLYEGEEVLGAQQNRTFDVTVLVPAHGRLQVPVSCVEAGRWDGLRHSESFAPAPQAAYPELRRAKNRHTRVRVEAGLDARADQREVWDEVAVKSARMGSHSPTGAMHDLFEGRRDRLREIGKAVRRHDGQLGALVAIGGRFVVLDWVSRPDVFEVLHGPLVQGYALDALEAGEDASVPSGDDAQGFLGLLTGTAVSERDGIGLGRDLRFSAEGIAGSGLVRGQELIQVTAFPGDGEEPPAGSVAAARAGRIRRPSRRRA